MILESLQIFIPFIFGGLYCFTVSYLLPRYPPNPYFMDCWLERFPKEFSEIFNVYFRSGIPVFLQSTQYLFAPLCLFVLFPFCFQLGITPVLALFLHRTIIGSLLSELDAVFNVTILLVWVAALFLLFLTSVVNRRSHQSS